RGVQWSTDSARHQRKTAGAACTRTPQTPAPEAAPPPADAMRGGIENSEDEPQQVIIADRARYQHRVGPVENTAVARDQVARVLDTRLPLDDRFAQVPNWPDQADQQAEDRAMQRGDDLRRGKQPDERPEDRRDDDATHEAFPRFLRADARRHLALAETAPHEIRGAVCHDHAAVEEDDQPRAVF